MKRLFKTTLLGILLSSTMAANASAQHFTRQFNPPLNLTVFNDSAGSIGARFKPRNEYRSHKPIMDMWYRGPFPGQQHSTPITDAQYRGPFPGTTNPISPGIPSQDFLRGKVTPGGSMGLNIPGFEPVRGGYPGNQFQGQSIDRIPRSFRNPKPSNPTRLYHSERQTIVGDSYNDGRGGSAYGNIGTVSEANLGLVAERDFAGVRGGVRGGLGAQGHVEQKYDINGVPLRNYSSGEVFLGTEANARAGLSSDGLGAGVGGFSGLRAQATSGFDAGVVDVSSTVEGRVGIGAEANGNIGLQDGRFRIKGEVGAALGIGGKVGVDTEVDLGDTGRFIEKTGNGAIKTVKSTAQDVDRWGQQAGKDVKRTADKVGGGIKRFGKSIFGKGK